MASDRLYYIARDGETHGPFPLEALPDLIQKGDLSPETHVWTEGMENWVIAANQPDVAVLFGGRPPAPPPSSTPQDPASENALGAPSRVGTAEPEQSEPERVSAKTQSEASAQDDTRRSEPSLGTTESARTTDKSEDDAEGQTIGAGLADPEDFRPSLFGCLIDGISLCFRRFFGLFIANAIIGVIMVGLYSLATGRLISGLPSWALQAGIVLIANIVLGGYWLMFVRRARGGKRAFWVLFGGPFKFFALTVALVGLSYVLAVVYWVLYGIAFLVAELPANQAEWVAMVPMILLVPLLIYTPFVIMDQRTGGFDGLGISRKVTYANGYFWTSALIILAGLVIALGLAPGVALERLGLDILSGALPSAYAEFALPIARIVTLIGGISAFTVAVAMVTFAYLGWADAPDPEGQGIRRGSG